MLCSILPFHRTTILLSAPFFFFTLAITVVSQLGAIVVDVVLLLVFLRTAIWNVTQDPTPVAV